VDSITQAALGAAVGDLVLGKPLGRRGMVWGAFFGTLPDLDILLFPWADTVQQLQWHRGISHSLLLTVLSGPLIAPWLAWHWKKFDVSKLRAGVFVFLVWSTHVLIDVFTAYGTQIWEPFSNARVTTSNLFIVDPLFTLPLLAGLGVSFFRHRQKAGAASARRAMRLGLIVTCAYTLWSFGARAWIERQVQPAIAALPNPAKDHLIGPTPFNTLLWRIIVRTGDGFHIGYRSILDNPDVPFQWYRIEQGAPDAKTRDSRALAAVDWFTEGWWLARETPKGLLMCDLRLGESLRDGQSGPTATMTPVFFWLLPRASDRPPLEMQRGSRGGFGKFLGQIFDRALGDPDALPLPSALRLPGQADESLPSPP
jgi:inner membrane protein